MNEKDLNRFTREATEYTGVSTRAYQNKQLVAGFSDAKCLNAYVELYLDEMDSMEHPISVLFTQEDLYFCVMKVFDYVLIGGPVCEVPIHPVQIESIAKRMEHEEKEEVVKTFAQIPTVPVSTIVFMVCIGYHQFTGVKLNPSEVLRNYTIHEAHTENAEQWKNFCSMDQAMMTNELIYQFERKCIRIIQMGREEDIEKLVDVLATDIPQKGPYHLRHYKNAFIIATTVISRAVVDFGVTAAESFALADYYINSCETLEQSDAIANLFFEMMISYRKSVRKVQGEIGNSEFIEKVNQYIQLHISEKIAIDQMAYHLGMSRNSLSGKFKKETGMMLSEYILIQKVERAKFLIATTDYSFAEISAYLAFSSQSHFQRVFKKYVSMTPKEYQNSI